MYSYEYTKDANILRLKSEIISAGLASISYLTKTATTVIATFANQLSSAEQDTLAAVITAHVKVTPAEYIDTVLAGAEDFGELLVRRFATRNMLAGKTDVQIDAIFDSNPDIFKISVGLKSGSLKYARRKLQAMTPDGQGITAADVTWMIGEITNFLGDG
jgi:hypothetical protein